MVLLTKPTPYPQQPKTIDIKRRYVMRFPNTERERERERERVYI